MKNYHIAKILVPTDLSELSQPALKYVRCLAESTKAKVEILHVVSDENQFIFSSELMNTEDENLDLDRYLAKEIMCNLSEKMLGDQIKPIIHTEIGLINDLIIESTIKSNSDLIVMGYYNDLDGSAMSYRVLDVAYKSPCPVLAVQPEMVEPTYKNIIVPLRDREGMIDKMQYVVGLAKNFNSKVHLIPFYTHSKTPIAKKRMNDLVDNVHALLEAENISYNSFKVISGKYVSKTLELSEKQGGDLIVILAEQSGFFQKLFGNADEENFLRKSRIPIMTVPVDRHLRLLPILKEEHHNNTPHQSIPIMLQRQVAF